jgi:hypothetical protein
MHILGVFSLNKILKDILDGILFEFFIDLMWLLEVQPNHTSLCVLQQRN